MPAEPMLAPRRIAFLFLDRTHPTDMHGIASGSSKSDKNAHLEWGRQLSSHSTKTKGQDFLPMGTGGIVGGITETVNILRGKL